MGTKAVYVVAFGEFAADSFEESRTGMLDLSCTYSGETASFLARREAAARAGSAVDVELPFPDWRAGDSLYEAETMRPRIRRIGAPGMPSPQILGFLVRYAVWRAALHAGDYSVAAGLVLKSTKLRPYLPILSSVAGKRAFLVLGLHWLVSFDPHKDTALSALLEGEKAEDRSLAPLVDFARSSFKARDLQAFRKELAAAIEAELVENRGGIVLGLVAEHFAGRAIQELRDQVKSAREEGLRRSLVEGLSGTGERVRAWVEGHRFFLAREPWNKADPNAIQVLFRKPGEEGTLQAGYLRRSVAAVLAPLADRGVAFSPRLFKLSRGECDLRVQACPPEPAPVGAT